MLPPGLQQGCVVNRNALFIEIYMMSTKIERGKHRAEETCLWNLNFAKILVKLELKTQQLLSLHVKAIPLY